MERGKRDFVSTLTDVCYQIPRSSLSISNGLPLYRLSILIKSHLHCSILTTVARGRLRVRDDAGRGEDDDDDEAREGHLQADVAAVSKAIRLQRASKAHRLYMRAGQKAIRIWSAPNKS
jgi:hypothetical protein